MLRTFFRYIIFTVIFWFLTFGILRVFFIIYQIPLGNKIHGYLEAFQAIYKGYILDFSVSAMFLLLPLLFVNLFYIFRKKIFLQTSFIVFSVIFCLYVSVALSDAGLYREWNAKINMQALEHFKNPSEVFKTLSNKSIFLFLFFMLVFCVPFISLYKKWIYLKIQFVSRETLQKRLLNGILIFIITGGLGVIAIRGGVTNLPINQSIAYFSSNQMANDIAVNPFYSLVQDLDIQSKLINREAYMQSSNEKALQIISSDYQVEKDTSFSILKTTRPNLVFIIMESWSADNIQALGGIENCTPHFNELSNEGLLFTKAYSDAYVSDQGIVGILSAFPAAHRLAIANQPAKIHHLPCLSETLFPLGYESSFLFGGELVYGNLRGFLLEKKFKELIEVYDLPQYPKGKLGIHDEYIFPELLKILNEKKTRFLQCFFTSSTHMPYDFPQSDGWQSVQNDAEKLYTESVHYSDIQLGKFFDEAKRQSWWDSTLFILVADHSHNTIKQWDFMSAMRQHIPLLFLGGALKEEWRGKRWDKIVSQLDIPATLLHQMKLDISSYPWSRNMLNPYTSSSAFYVFYGGAGYVSDNGYIGINYSNKDNINTSLLDSNELNIYKKKALAFQQLVFENVRLRK